MQKIYLLFLSCFSVGLLFAQPSFPDKGVLYNDQLVPRIDITISPDTLAWLYQDENLESDVEFSARFVFNDGTVCDTIDSIGFRLRGNTSRYSQKKSFKISFNTFTDGGKYYGVEKLNLNGEHNDPSIMRAKVCWDILRKWNIPAPRSNHVQLYINGNYYGLYLSVEHIDEEFAKARFSNNDGNLYKCTYPADLVYLGPAPDNYKYLSGDTRAYELKINEEQDDYSDLANFIDILNNTPDEELVCKLDEVFNVYDYLKVVAVDILTGNWDGPLYNKNNFYLYHNTQTNKFEFIPYDLDNTLGVDWMGIDWTTRNVYQWSPDDAPRPLYTRLMANQELRNQFTYYIKELVASTIDFDSLNTAMTQMIARNAQYVENDPYYPRDYGFTLSDFNNSLWVAFGAHVKSGISQFLHNRVYAINQQIEAVNMQPIIKYIQHQRISASELWVRAYVDVEEAPATVFLWYQNNADNQWYSIAMMDDGQHNDEQAGDHIYGAVLSELNPALEISYQIEAKDALTASSLLPCNPVVVMAWNSEVPLLFINEFMASNDNTITDEYGSYSDWVEVYNASSEAVWLGDLYMTDDLASPLKWQMPDYTLEAGGFALFWADGSPEDGSFHADFKLSAGGEELGIFTSSEMPIDQLSFGEQTTDVSYGRQTDGGANWKAFVSPTPGYSNQTVATEERQIDPSFLLFPNPASGSYIYLNKPMNYKVYSVLGQLVVDAHEQNSINISGLQKGMYLFVNDQGAQQKFMVQ